MAGSWSFGSLLLPWYGIEDGFFSFEWMVSGYLLIPIMRLYSGIYDGEKQWLAPLIFHLISAFAILAPNGTKLKTYLFLFGGGFGLFWLIAQGLAIGIRGGSLRD